MPRNHDTDRAWLNALIADMGWGNIEAVKEMRKVSLRRRNWGWIKEDWQLNMWYEILALIDLLGDGDFIPRDPTPEEWMMIAALDDAETQYNTLLNYKKNKDFLNIQDMGPADIKKALELAAEEEIYRIASEFGDAEVDPMNVDHARVKKAIYLLKKENQRNAYAFSKGDKSRSFYKDEEIKYGLKRDPWKYLNEPRFWDERLPKNAPSYKPSVVMNRPESDFEAEVDEYLAERPYRRANRPPRDRPDGLPPAIAAAMLGEPPVTVNRSGGEVSVDVNSPEELVLGDARPEHTLLLTNGRGESWFERESKRVRQALAAGGTIRTKHPDLEEEEREVKRVMTEMVNRSGGVKRS